MQKSKWYSGGFEIKENRWEKRNVYEQKYPIIEDQLLLVRNDVVWAIADHFGAVDCGNDRFKMFKVINLVQPPS